MAFQRSNFNREYDEKYQLETPWSAFNKSMLSANLFDMVHIVYEMASIVHIITFHLGSFFCSKTRRNHLKLHHAAIFSEARVLR